MSVVCKVLSRPLKTIICDFNYLNGFKFTTARTFITSQHLWSIKKLNFDSTKLVKKDGTVIRKRTEEKKLITLVHNSTEKVLTLTEALKLADHKGLYLIKIKKPNPKSMDFYQLSNAPELTSKELQKKNIHVKKYTFRTNIAEHDLLNKAKGLIQALNKYKIACYIIENETKDPNLTENISSAVQKAITNAGINFLIKSTKGSLLYRTFIVEVKEQDVKDGTNNKGSDASQGNGKKS